MAPRYGTHPLRHFYRTEQMEYINSARFRIGQLRAAFTMRNIRDAPEGQNALFERLLDHFLNLADERAGRKSQSCSVIIRSEILDQPIQIPYRSMAQNTPAVVLEQFDTVEQSGRWKGRPSLFSQPIHIEVVMGPSREETQEILGGSGRPKRVIRHNVDINNLIEVNNDYDETLCLLLAVQLTKRHQELTANDRRENMAFQRLCRGKSQQQKRRRLLLIVEMLLSMKKHGVDFPLQLVRYDIEQHLPLVQQYLNRRFGVDAYRLTLFSGSGRMRPLWKGSKWPARVELCLYLHEGHYWGIRKYNRLFGTPHYCLECEKPFFCKVKHRANCRSKCTKCCGMGHGFPCPQIRGFMQQCNECNKLFQNPRCYQRHLDSHICKIYRCCLECGHNYRVRAGDEHVCFAIHCADCKGRHSREESCYVQPIIPPINRPAYLLIPFDFECSLLSPEAHPEEWASLIAEQQMEELPANDPNYRFHRVNCVSAMLLCSECIQDECLWKAETTLDCPLCGPGKRRMHTWTAEEGENPLSKFLHWLIEELGKYRRIRTYAVAHYGGRYDMHLLLGEMRRNGCFHPKITRNGNKLFEVLLKRRRGITPFISFRDSFNWMSLKLDDLPRALTLDMEASKGFFPYGFNFNRLMNVHLPELPPAELYYPESMAPKRREAFYRWYAENKQRPFCLSEQIKIYCEQDVWLLTNAIIKFRELFLSLATAPEKGDDVLVSSLTLASACNRHFCINYLDAGTVAITPENGYFKDSNQSAIAIKFLCWLANDTGLNIQHRDTVFGEKRVRLNDGRMLRLDGFISRPNLPDIAIEFLGCAWHAHDCIYEDVDELCLNGKTVQHNREQVEKRKMDLECAGYETAFIWECCVRKAMQKDKDMREYMENLRTWSPLIPRDAFHGGRTGPLAMKIDLIEAGCEEEYEISCYDIVSLYPASNFYSFYPLGRAVIDIFSYEFSGHPEAIDINKAVEWTCVEHLKPYRGIFKLFLIPPDDLYLPVIAEKIHGKLMFHCCRSCAMESEAVAKRLEKPYTQTLGQELCAHSDDERGFVCTVASPELELALQKGYRATWVYSVYHWTMWSDQLFRPYVQQMMKLKIEASGWPDNVLCGDDSVEEQRRKHFYVEENEKRYGIHLDPAKIFKNEGRRYLAKLCNNSMWGRWGLRCNLVRDLITDCPIELHRLLNDQKLEIGCVEMLTPELFAVPYRKRQEFVKSHDRYNIVLALFTTAEARVRLYAYMQAVYNMPNTVLLYTDTDSVIFVHPKGMIPNFEVGEMLGMMSHEYKEAHIDAFYSGGCKQYALKMKRFDGQRDHLLKLRGCWTDSKMDFEQFKKMVDNYGASESIQLERTHFRPDWRRGEVTSRSQTRSYTPIYDKGIVDSLLHVYPYGYRGAPLKFPQIFRK